MQLFYISKFIIKFKIFFLYYQNIINISRFKSIKKFQFKFKYYKAHLNKYVIKKNNKKLIFLR